MLKSCIVIVAFFIAGTIAEEAAEGTADAAAGKILLASFEGTYELEVADEEDFVKVLEAFGLEEKIINKWKANKFLVLDTPNKEGEKYKITWKTTAEATDEPDEEFDLGQEQDKVFGTVNAKRTFTADADTLTDTITAGDKTLTITLDFKGTEITSQVKCGDAVADRKYKKVAAQTAA